MTEQKGKNRYKNNSKGSQEQTRRYTDEDYSDASPLLDKQSSHFSQQNNSISMLPPFTGGGDTQHQWQTSPRSMGFTPSTGYQSPNQ